MGWAFGEHRKQGDTLEVFDLADDGLKPLVALEDIESTHCHWPYDGLMCCGRERQGKGDYCAIHAKRSHRHGHVLTDEGRENVRHAAVERNKKRGMRCNLVSLIVLDELG